MKITRTKSSRTQGLEPNLKRRLHHAALTSGLDVLADFNACARFSLSSSLSLAHSASLQTIQSLRRSCSTIGTVAVTVEGVPLHFNAGKGHFWNCLLTSGDRLKAFAVLERGDKHSWSHEGVYEFSPGDYRRDPAGYKPRSVTITGGAPAAPRGVFGWSKDGITIRMSEPPMIDEIYAASKSGDTLLVAMRIHLEKDKDTGTEMPLSFPAMSFRMQPWFLDTVTGKVTPVTP